MRADVSDEKQVKDMFKEVFRIYGKVDVLINNAGISLIRVIQDTSAEDWQRVLSVNVGGVFLCSREVTDNMICNGGGAIINVASIWGEVGASCEVAYSASKGAVIAFTKALAKELAPSHITVNCVTPGVINTAMNARFTSEELNAMAEDIPVGRFGEAAEVARAILFLGSEPYITGQILGVNGGAHI